MTGLKQSAPHGAIAKFGYDENVSAKWVVQRFTSLVKNDSYCISELNNTQKKTSQRTGNRHR
ncbi:hypothetical protein GCM10011498_05460 [Amylibacter cionae]|uniref:Uncharacterized protein n=1 Tax=Neptunicoccus cionae TaxID=2035344 RepID=A0A916VMC8_9RHOB|nr:hypothetical protein GCM10011498_05460 [Amylibacter cionae]